ncbi:MAG: hypothetical protein KDE31_07810, partial [Caldilineaceae bacterium]|nr:hypothetical protein [Caldilineaceae bacterium]
MQQKAFDVHPLIKWIVLNGLLWPVGFILYASFVDILIDGIGRLGFYAACPRMYGIPSPTILLTSNACLQGWFAFHFCWTGMIVGAMVGFTQWRFVLRPITIPDTWITINTISLAIGGPLAYLSYRLFLHDLGSQLALRSLQAIPEMTIFTWVILLSEAISCFGEQWLLGKQGPKSTHWVLSSLLGIASAGCVHLLIGQWIPVIVYGGLFVGVTS